MTFPLFHCSLHSRPHHAVSVTQRHVRSHFDSKALHFRIRPYCHKRGLRVSGGECGPVCAMWHPFGLPSPIRGGQMLADHSRKTVSALPCAIWERKGPDKPALKSRECTGPACLFWGQYAGVILCQKSSFHHPAKFAQFYKCQQKKDKRACAKFAHYCFSLLDKILVKDIGSGTDTAASRYNHRRESVQPPPLIV